MGQVTKPNLNSAPPVVVSRCDRIGDLVLSLPSLDYLKRCGFRYRVLHCSAYAADIAEWALHNGLCEDIWVAGTVAPRRLASESREAWGLCLHLSRESTQAFKSIGLRQSVGPRTKLWALWNLKYSIAQHRSRVEKSEMEYNLDLARALVRKLGRENADFVGLPALKVPPTWVAPRPSPDLVLVASNRGSARDWSLQRYLETAREALRAGKSVDLLLSGDDAPEKRAALAHEKDLEALGVVGSFARLRELVAYLVGAREVISSSTGPLHIAHAAGVPVLGLYPRERVQSFDRWRPHGYWHDASVRFCEID